MREARRDFKYSRLSYSRWCKSVIQLFPSFSRCEKKDIYISYSELINFPSMVVMQWFRWIFNPYRFKMKDLYFFLMLLVEKQGELLCFSDPEVISRQTHFLLHLLLSIMSVFSVNYMNGYGPDIIPISCSLKLTIFMFQFVCVLFFFTSHLALAISSFHVHLMYELQAMNWFMGSPKL